MTVDTAGDVNTGGTLGISGLSTLGALSAGSSTLSYATVTNNASIGGALGVTGATTLRHGVDHQIISVTGNSFFGGNVATTAEVQIGTTTAAVGSSAPLLTVGKGIGSPPVYPFYRRSVRLGDRQ